MARTDSALDELPDNAVMEFDTEAEQPLLEEFSDVDVDALEFFY